MASKLNAALSWLAPVAADPADPAYRRQQATEVIDGFRVLSLLVCITTAAMFLMKILQWDSPPASHHTASLAVWAVLAAAGIFGFRASRSIQSPTLALVATAALLGTSVAAVTMDRLLQSARDGVPAPSVIPAIFILLMLGAALMPLRPLRVLGLGVLLLLSCAASVAFMGVPLKGSFMDSATALLSVAISVAISARFTAQRIRLYNAHAVAVRSAKETEAARSRALMAESAVTMERLAASLSHELNTPIGALKSATDTLIRGVARHASFPKGSHMPELVEELSAAILQSAARLSETVARIQRFANLDRSAIRLTDVNQLIQDAVALMNPPSFNQAQIVLHLDPVPQVWCKPHRLSAALASILNMGIEGGYAVTIDTYAAAAHVNVEVTITGGREGLPEQQELTPGFGVEAGRVRATGWDLFAARQLVWEIGGDLRIERTGPGERAITVTIPVTVMAPRQSAA